MIINGQVPLQIIDSRYLPYLVKNGEQYATAKKIAELLCDNELMIAINDARLKECKMDRADYEEHDERYR